MAKLKGGMIVTTNGSASITQQVKDVNLLSFSADSNGTGGAVINITLSVAKGIDVIPANKYEEDSLLLTKAHWPYVNDKPPIVDAVLDLSANNGITLTQSTILGARVLSLNLNLLINAGKIGGAGKFTSKKAVSKKRRTKKTAKPKKAAVKSKNKQPETNG